MTTHLNRNPFSTEYYVQEMQALASLAPRTFRNIELKHETISGRVDGFMYKAFLTGLDSVPVLFIDGKLWMSLTPMEIESHYMPIQLATGKVGVGGLGLGYYTQRILEKEDVSQVIVYETNPDVIDFYLENFGEHEKLCIRNENVRTLENETFDFFYNDIYLKQMDENAIPDMARLTEKNDIKQYHFWTFEEYLLEMIHAGYAENLPRTWLRTYYPLIEQLIETKGNLLRISGFGEDYYETFETYGLI